MRAIAHKKRFLAPLNRIKVTFHLSFTDVALHRRAGESACLHRRVCPFGGPGSQFQFPDLVFPILLTIGIILSLGEEIGWRGFALPHLQSRSNPVVASLIIGVLWAFWHVPGNITNLSLLTSPSTYIAFLWFLGLTVSGSVLMAWVYNHTGGSLFLMALSHLGLTALWQFVALPQQVGQFGPAELSVVLMGITALMVVVLDARMRTTTISLP